MEIFSKSQKLRWCFPFKLLEIHQSYPKNNDVMWEKTKTHSQKREYSSLAKNKNDMFLSHDIVLVSTKFSKVTVFVVTVVFVKKDRNFFSLLYTHRIHLKWRV